jgi:hypothetical protein
LKLSHVAAVAEIATYCKSDVHNFMQANLCKYREPIENCKTDAAEHQEIAVSR